MTDQDFTALFNDARARGAVAKMLHPLVLIITTPEYAAIAPGLGGGAVVDQSLPMPASAPTATPP